jgi:hypothetical protein
MNQFTASSVAVDVLVADVWGVPVAWLTASALASGVEMIKKGIKGKQFP